MNTLMHSDPFWTALCAVDRLNSWLRSDPDNPRPTLQSQLKHIIYWTKKKAIQDATKHFVCRYRRVAVSVQCHTCGGSGRFWPWWADSYVDIKCRHCDGTGIARLRFVESHINGLLWHTPQHDWFMGSLNIATGFESRYPEETGHLEVAGWTVKQPGRPLQFNEVVRDINLLCGMWPKEVLFIIEFDHHLKGPRDGTG